MQHYARPGDPLAEARLFAQKFSFGPTPALVDQIHAATPMGWLDQQLAWQQIPEPPELASTFGTFQTLTLEGPERAASDIRYQMPTEQTGVTLLRAIHSPRHLHEVLVEFWNDHFNVAFLSRALDMTVLAFDRDVARTHATGRFADMLHASARSVAMMVYLDNDASRWPHPNENYARELMELHTLGVDGGYTEADVTQAARALTGWSRSSLRDDDHYFGFVYREEHHYTEGPIRVMELEMPAMSGPESIEHGTRLLDYLASHPATARHVCTKLARRFVSDFPSPGLVDALVAAWQGSDGDIATVMRALASHPEFRASSGAKLRRPFQVFVAMLRALGDSVTYNPRGGGESDFIKAADRTLAGMGQRPFRWPAPNGYPDVAGYWAATAGVLARWNVALAIVRDQIGGMEFHPPILRNRVDAPTVHGLVVRLFDRLLGRGPTGQEQAAVVGLSAVPGDGAAADVTDEEFRAMVAMVLSTPAAQRR